MKRHERDSLVPISYIKVPQTENLALDGFRTNRSENNNHGLKKMESGIKIKKFEIGQEVHVDNAEALNSNFKRSASKSKYYWPCTNTKSKHLRYEMRSESGKVTGRWIHARKPFPFKSRDLETNLAPGNARYIPKTDELDTFCTSYKCVWRIDNHRLQMRMQKKMPLCIELLHENNGHRRRLGESKQEDSKLLECLMGFFYGSTMGVHLEEISEFYMSDYPEVQPDDYFMSFWSEDEGLSDMNDILLLRSLFMTIWQSGFSWSV